jgi:hypothetical protein
LTGSPGPHPKAGGSNTVTSFGCAPANDLDLRPEKRCRSHNGPHGRNHLEATGASLGVLPTDLVDAENPQMS